MPVALEHHLVERKLFQIEVVAQVVACPTFLLPHPLNLDLMPNLLFLNYAASKGSIASASSGLHVQPMIDKFWFR